MWKPGADPFCMMTTTSIHREEDAMSITTNRITIERRDGGNFQFCPPEAQTAIPRQLRGNPLITLHEYPGQNHAFARPGGEHYNAAAELANLRSLEFFARHLVSQG